AAWWSAGCVHFTWRRTDFTGARYRNTGAQTVRSARTVGDGEWCGGRTWRGAGFSVKSGGPCGGDTGRCGSAYLAALGPAEGCRGRVLVRPVAGAYATARGCGTAGTDI